MKWCWISYPASSYSFLAQKKHAHMEMPPLEFAYQLACMPFNAREGPGCPKDQIGAKIYGEVWAEFQFAASLIEK